MINRLTYLYLPKCLWALFIIVYLSIFPVYAETIDITNFCSRNSNSFKTVKPTNDYFFPEVPAITFTPISECLITNKCLYRMSSNITSAYGLVVEVAVNDLCHTANRKFSKIATRDLTQILPSLDTCVLAFHLTCEEFQFNKFKMFSGMYQSEVSYTISLSSPNRMNNSEIIIGVTIFHGNEEGLTEDSFLEVLQPDYGRISDGFYILGDKSKEKWLVMN